MPWQQFCSLIELSQWPPVEGSLNPQSPESQRWGSIHSPRWSLGATVKGAIPASISWFSDLCIILLGHGSIYGSWTCSENCVQDDGSLSS